MTMASQKSLDQWKEQFEQFDKDGNGSLSVHELRDLMRTNDSKIPDSQIADRFITIDGPTGDRRITLDEFVSGMQRLQSKIEEVKGLFQETDKDGSGYLTADELRPLITNIYPNLPDSEMAQIFQAADQSGDGKISLQEFINTCT